MKKNPWKNFKIKSKKDKSLDDYSAFWKLPKIKISERKKRIIY